MTQELVLDGKVSFLGTKAVQVIHAAGCFQDERCARKAKKMGKIAFNCARQVGRMLMVTAREPCMVQQELSLSACCLGLRPYLMGPKDWFARVDTSLLFAKA